MKNTIFNKHLHKILIKIISPEHQWKLSIHAQWDFLIGTLKDKVILEKVTNDSLILSVCHASWAQELLMLTPLLKKKVNALFDTERIKHIRLRTIDFSLRKQRFSEKIDKKIQTDELLHQQPLRYLSNREQRCLKKVGYGDLREDLESYAFRCKQTMQKGERNDNEKKK